MFRILQEENVDMFGEIRLPARRRGHGHHSVQIRNTFRALAWCGRGYGMSQRIFVVSGDSRWSQATTSADAGQPREYLSRSDHPDRGRLGRKKASARRPGRPAEKSTQVRPRWETGVTARVGGSSARSSPAAATRPTGSPVPRATSTPMIATTKIATLPPAVAVRVCRPPSKALGSMVDMPAQRT